MVSQFVTRDVAEPTTIEHRCEEMFDGDELEQIYNYFVYRFDRKDMYFWARAYLDEIDAVYIYGPFERRGTTERISGSLDEAMLSYFQRPFGKIKILDNGSYVTVWSR